MFSIIKKQAPSCPYCNSELEKYPTRSKKCPKCKETINVIKDSENGTNLLLKDDAVHKQKLINMYFDTLSIYEISKNELGKKRDKWFNKFPHSSYADLLRSTYNELIFNYSKIAGYVGLSLLYKDLAILNKSEGIPYSHLLEQSYKQYILECKPYFKEMYILSHPDSCDSCKKLHGKLISIEEALRTMPLPNKDCTCGHGEFDCRYGDSFNGLSIKIK